MMAPLTPVSPRWMCASVAVSPSSEMLPLSARDGDTRDNVPVPNAPVSVGVTSWSPDSAADNTVVVLAGAGLRPTASRHARLGRVGT